MNDREQSRLLGNLSLGVFGGLYAVVFVYMLTFEPFGPGSVMYGVAGAMGVVMSVVSLLLVRQQLTDWDTEANIELLRSRRQAFLLIAIFGLQYHNVPDQWQPTVAVVTALSAAFATVQLSRPLYKIILTPSMSHQRE